MADRYTGDFSREITTAVLWLNRLQDTAAIEDALRAQGVNEPERYFTDAPFIEGGLTYVLTKMWGRGAEPALSALRDTFATAGVSFQAED